VLVRLRLFTGSGGPNHGFLLAVFGPYFRNPNLLTIN